MKLFHALTQQLTLAAFNRATPESSPMLNESGGALCYVDFADCIKASIALSEALEVSAPMAAVVHIEYDDALHDELVASGLIVQSRDQETLGKPIFSIAGAACVRLNAEASFTASFHRLNPIIGKSLSSSG